MKRLYIIMCCVLLAIMPVAAQSYGFYGRGKPITKSRTGYNPMGVGGTNSLGITTGVSAGDGEGVASSGSGGGGSFSSVTYGRSALSLATNKSYYNSASQGLSVANSGKTTVDGENGDDASATYEFLEPPRDGAPPVGDAVLPLMLLLVPVVLIKIRKRE